MLKTYLYVPDHLNERLNNAARAQNKSKAEVMRQALEKGLDATEKKGGAEVLLKLAEFAKKHKVKGPGDLSANHDYYLWGGEKKDRT